MKLALAAVAITIETLKVIFVPGADGRARVRPVSGLAHALTIM